MLSLKTTIIHFFNICLLLKVIWSIDLNNCTVCLMINGGRDRDRRGGELVQRASWSDARPDR